MVHSVTPYVSDPHRVWAVHAVFVALYAVAFGWAFSTVGIPLQEAYEDLIEEAAKKNTVVNLDDLSLEVQETLPSRFFPSPLRWIALCSGRCCGAVCPGC